MASFKTKYIIDIYVMALEGANDKTIAKALGITPAGFVGWKKAKKSVQYALKKAKKDRNKNKSLNWTEYVTGRLPKHLLPVWNKVTEYDKEISGYGKIQKLLGKETRHARQELLVYAILISGFNLSKALRMVAIPRSTFIHWGENDPDFVELLTEVEQIKKDFFEEGLIKLVKAGDSPATIFGNRTLNRDRGYGEVTETKITGMIGVASVQIGELDLSPEVLRTILNAVQTKEAAQKKLPRSVNHLLDVPNIPLRKKIEAKVT